MRTDTPSSIADALAAVVGALRSGDFSGAEASAGQALTLDFEDPRVQAALKVAVYWKDREVRAAALTAPGARGDFLLREWKGFLGRFRAHLDVPFEEGVEAAGEAVQRRAAEAYLAQVAFEDDPAAQADLLVRAARAFKGCGAFDRALSTLESVLQARPDDAAALAEMADCFEAVGEASRARLFFREAFYLNAQAVDLEQLRSPEVRGVVQKLSAEGKTGAELKEWIPVYAVAGGVFSVKRDLKSLEVGQLKQGINALKAELHDGTGVGVLVLPRLIYRYFWLIDHYFSVQEDRSKIEDILLNIKLLDEHVYELYTH